MPKLALHGEAAVTRSIAELHKQCRGVSEPLVQQSALTAVMRLVPLQTGDHADHVQHDTGSFCFHRIDPPPCLGDRAHLLEEQLSSQERITAFLLHQAFQSKNDVVSYLQGSKGQHRETDDWLPKNPITGIVKKLSQDTEVIPTEKHSPCFSGAALAHGPSSTNIGCSSSKVLTMATMLQINSDFCLGQWHLQLVMKTEGRGLGKVKEKKVI